VETYLTVDQKQIKLRDDHGQDVLETFAKKIIKSPYVEGIINSLPFNPKARESIKKCTPDGKIEIVLTTTDKGIGLVIQSTGRNLKETQAIAEFLQHEYLT